jgi:hypothetical protein
MRRLVVALALLLASVPIAAQGQDYIVHGRRPAPVDEEFVPANSEALVLNAEILLSDVGTLAAFVDTSGAGNDISETTAGLRPTTTGTQRPNGWFCARFDPGDDEMNEGGPTLTGDYRAFAFAFFNTTVPDGGMIVGGSSGVRGLFEDGGSGRIEWRSSSGDQQTILNPPTVAYYTIFIVENYADNTIDIWLDGTQIVTAGALNGAPISDTFRPERSGYQPKGRDVCRMLAWDSTTELTWSAGEIEAINDHLAEGSWLLLWWPGLRRRMRQVANNNEESRCRRAA